MLASAYVLLDGCLAALRPDDSRQHVVIVGASFGGLAAQQPLEQPARVAPHKLGHAQVACAGVRAASGGRAHREAAGGAQLGRFLVPRRAV